MSDILTIGERIATLRKLRGFSQNKLAELTGKTRSAIAQIETGGYNPDHEFIRDIVRICNSSYEYIFGDTDKPEKSDDSKNEMHIKNPEKGVRYSDEKGGKVTGKVSGDSENEKHIKGVQAPMERRLSPEEIKAVGKAEFEKRMRAMEVRFLKVDTFNEPDEITEYGSLKAQMASVLNNQAEVMGKILDKLEDLERRQNKQEGINRTGEGAELPGGKK